MKKSDFLTLIIVSLIIGVFIFVPKVLEGFHHLTATHGLLMSFVKFSFLATFGEMLALRIKKGNYIEQGFGIVPRFLIWGILGMCIATAMTIFKSGTLTFLTNVGLEEASQWFSGGFSWGKLFVAFCISILMNTFFAPVFMTFHKITDIHIAETGGSIKGFLTAPLKIEETLSHKINWKIQYGFVFKKTIPLFWYPAHTITFMLPGNYQVVFAALLGVVLGLILSIKK